MTALFFVRAEVADPGEREAFDRWYEHEHLPQAAAAFQAVMAWRGWSEVDPAIHYPFYELADFTAAQAILNSEALKELIAEFDRVWGTRVTRTPRWSSHATDLSLRDNGIRETARLTGEHNHMRIARSSA